MFVSSCQDNVSLQVMTYKTSTLNLGYSRKSVDAKRVISVCFIRNVCLNWYNTHWLEVNDFIIPFNDKSKEGYQCLKFVYLALKNIASKTSISLIKYH